MISIVVEMQLVEIARIAKIADFQKWPDSKKSPKLLKYYKNSKDLKLPNFSDVRPQKSPKFLKSPELPKSSIQEANWER